MKKLHLIAATILLIVSSSCRSIEKLVDKGRYDEAIDLAVQKLDRNKELKTKHLVALEEGFDRINSRDLKKIGYIKEEEAGARWDEIYHIIQRIESRQKRLDLLMPITSEDGYTASFDFVETRGMKREASMGAAKYHYSLAQLYLSEYDSLHERSLARAAFDELERVEQYIPSYANTEQLAQKAYDGGVAHVLLKWDQTAFDVIPRKLHHELLLEAEENQDRFWIRFHDIYDKAIDYDVLVQIVIDDLIIGPDREEINRSQESRIILGSDDTTPPQDTSQANPQEQSPTKGQETLVYIVETRRSKRIDLVGRFEMRDYTNGKLLDSQDFNLSDDFFSSSVDESIYEGEISLGEANSYTKYGNTLEPFPSDHLMISRGLLKLKDRFRSFTSRIQAI